MNIEDGARWKVPYYMLKIDSRDFLFEEKAKGLNRNAVKVGDIVGFSRESDEIIGRIERLNPKTVSLITAEGHRWRVAYAMLYPVIEGQMGSDKRVIDYKPE